VGNLPAEQVSKRPPIIAVRPRKDSDLLAIQEANNNDMADILHSWATVFAENVKQSEQGEPDQ
jgi:hypothetical protein